MSKSSEHTLQIGVIVCLKEAETKCKVVSSLLINSDILSTRKIFFFHEEYGFIILVIGHFSMNKMAVQKM